MPVTETPIAAPQDILTFWQDAGPKIWWTKDADFDARILEKFGATYHAATAGKLDDWEHDPQSALALVIVLDQFSRNLNRNSPLAFAQDEKALGIANRLIDGGGDSTLEMPLQQFAYLPLMHSESLDDQERCVKIFERYDLPDNLKAAVEHRDIIRDFGRFPHRNGVLGRNTTAAEQAFLDGGGFKG